VWYPFFSYISSLDADANIFVLGSDNDINYQLIEYAWEAPPS
jgi:hypothetical protein